MEEKPNTLDYLNKAEAEVERLKEHIEELTGKASWLTHHDSWIVGLTCFALGVFAGAIV